MKKPSSTCCRGLLVAALVAACAVFSGADSQAQSRGFRAATLVPPPTARIEPGGETVVTLTLRIRPGYHVNSNKPNEDYLIPTRLSWDAAPLELKSVDYPAGESVKYDFSDKPLSVYSGKLVIRSTFAAPETIPAGLNEIKGKIRYQACNDKACFAPVSIDVRVPVLQR